MFEVFSRTMGQFVQSSAAPAKREPDHLCYGCKKPFRPYLLYRQGEKAKQWRCRACYDKWLARATETSYERWRRWYETHKERKVEINRAYNQRKKAKEATS